MSRIPLMSLESLSVSLGRDRRSLAKALKTIAPDEYETGQGGRYPVFRLDRALGAIQRHDEITGYSKRVGSDGDRNRAALLASADEQERLWDEGVEPLLRKLRATARAERTELLANEGNVIIRWGIEAHRSAMLVPADQQPMCYATADWLVNKLCEDIEALLTSDPDPTDPDATVEDRDGGSSHP
jgi:hypothetical protein